MTEVQIAQEPFVLGSGQQNKYPGGYISRVSLNGRTFETLDPSPNMGRLSCIMWCMMPHDMPEQPPASPETGPISG